MPGGTSGGGRGQQRAGPDIFGKKVPGVEEMTAKTWKALKEEDKERQNVVAVFYRSGGRGDEGLKDVFREFGEKFSVASAGLVRVVAINCGKLQAVCEEADMGGSLPAVMYMDPGGKSPRHPEGGISFKSLSTFVSKNMGDFTTVLVEENAFRRWLSSDDKVPKAIFFTDRKTTPPLMKTLSIEFKGRAALGVVLAGAEASLVARFGVKERPTLLYISDEDTLDGDLFDKQFTKEHMSYFLSRAVGKHRSAGGAQVRELTAARYNGGDCDPKDSNFCLLLFSSVGEAGVAARKALKAVASRLRHDPVKVFFVRHRGLSKAFGSSPGSVILYRPKRKRYSVFGGSAASADDLAAFVDGAIGGGAPLPEVLASAPTMKDEL